MKIIHCADIHADSKMGSHFSREQAEIRRKEVVDAFADMVGYAKQNDIHVILIAGDFFDTKETQQKKIKQRVSYIMQQNPDIDFLYLRGNHDEDSSFADTAVIPNLKLFSKDEWRCYSYGPVDIYGHELGKTVPASVYGGLVPDAARVNIVALHGQVAGYTTKKDAPDISLPKLSNKNVDYLALGHIHEHRLEKLDSRGVWSYAGCLEGRGFDESGEKGFVVLDIEDGKIKAEFVPHARRIIHDITVPLSGSLSFDDIMALINDALEGICRDDIVQVTLTGEITEDTDIETESYQAALESRFFFIRFKDKTEPFIDYTKYAKDVSLKGEFIRLVKEQTDLTEEEKTEIIMTGIKALAGRLN